MWTLFKVFSFLYNEITSEDHMIYDAIWVFEEIFIQQYDIFFDSETQTLKYMQNEKQGYFVRDSIERDLKFLLNFLEKLFRKLYIEFIEENIVTTQLVKD